MLKMLPDDEGPDELRLNRMFSSEPLASNPRNHCAPLLDVIQLPNDPPIMVHSLLRLYFDPPFHTYGEFVAFFGQICEVRRLFSASFVTLLSRSGDPIYARESRRSSVSTFLYDAIQASDLVRQGLHVTKHHA